MPSHFGLIVVCRVVLLYAPHAPSSKSEFLKLKLGVSEINILLVYMIVKCIRQKYGTTKTTTYEVKGVTLRCDEQCKKKLYKLAVGILENYSGEK